MKLLFVLINLSLVFLISCSDQNFSTISQTAQSHPTGSDAAVENRNKIESTDIGNGMKPDEGSFDSGQFNLTCQRGSQDRYGCMLAVNSFVGVQITGISWEVRDDNGSCTVNELGYTNGTNLSISFVSSPECAEWIVDVNLTLANGQTGVVTFDSEELSGDAETGGSDDGEQNSGETDADGESPDESVAEGEHKNSGMIALDSLLMDIDGGIAGGHFDVDAYDCLDAGIITDDEEEDDSGKKSKGKGDEGCLVEHVDEYDIEAKRNGINLKKPKVSESKLKLDTSEDFCILAINANLSQEAIVKLNRDIFKVTSLSDSWEPNCPTYNMQDLTSLEISFPVNVLSIENGIKRSISDVAQTDLARDQTLLIRFVNSSTGEFIKEYSIYSN